MLTPFKCGWIRFSHPANPTPQEIEAIRRFASCHEAGHALVAWLKLLIPDINHVFVGRQLQKGHPSAYCRVIDSNRTDKKYLKDRMAVLVAGPVAVELIYHKGSLGSENDVLEAFTIAQDMVCKYGHCDALGNRQFPGYAVGGCTQNVRKQIDEEIRTLLVEAINTAQRIIIDHQDEWTDLVEALLANETQTFTEIEKIFGPRPKP